MMRTTQTTTVRLLSHTKHPVETVYCEWFASRSSGPCPDPEVVAEKCAIEGNEILKAEVLETFQKVVEMKIPVAETVDFVFLIEHCPIALREQIVRHRIGHRFAGRLGADVIPDLSESTFWAQTMRVLNMGTFATEGEYLLPESVRCDDVGADTECEDCGGTGLIKVGQDQLPDLCPCWRKKHKCIRVRGKNVTVEEFYHEQMTWIQSAYNKLVAAGVPIEDSRNLLPLACQHRLTWKLNLSSLLHVLSKRGCWIAQLGMWEPIIRGMVDELATRVHPLFRRLIDPPCFSGGEFTGCVFKLENENRVVGEDPYAPCPLYLSHHGSDQARSDVASKRWPELTVRGEAYRELWRRDEWTGEKLGEADLASAP